LLSLLSQQWLQATGFGIGMIVFLFGLRQAREEERLVVEFWGRFWGIKGPGPCWIIFLIMRVRAIVSIWEQDVDLFPEKPNIDFRGGGTAQLVNPKAWLKVEDIYSAVYNVADWRKAVRARTENLMRDFLSNQSVEEVIDQESIHPWWQLIKEELGGKTNSENPEQEILDSWGIKITKITIEDFQWSEEVVKTRKDVFEAQRDIERQKNLADAAVHKAHQQALQSGGVHGEIVRLLTAKPYNYTHEKAENIASRLVEYYKGAETGTLRDWRGGALESVIERFIQAFNLTKKEGENKKEVIN